MSTSAELVVTYPGVRIPGKECVRIIRGSSLWHGVMDGSTEIHISHLSNQGKNTEIRLKSKTHMHLTTDLRWNDIRPSIETVSPLGNRMRIQNSIVREEEMLATVNTERTSVAADAEKYMLEAQLHFKEGWVHLGYMYPTFDSKEQASEFHHNHYPHLPKMTAKTGWKSACSADDDVRYVVRVHGDEALTLNMRTVGSAAMERSVSGRPSK